MSHDTFPLNISLVKEVVLSLQLLFIHGTENRNRLESQLV